MRPKAVALRLLASAAKIFKESFAAEGAEGSRWITRSFPSTDNFFDLLHKLPLIRQPRDFMLAAELFL